MKQKVGLRREQPVSRILLEGSATHSSGMVKIRIAVLLLIIFIKLSSLYLKKDLRRCNRSKN